jgi:hypothetical protein
MEATDKLGPTSTLGQKAARTIEAPRSGSRPGGHRLRYNRFLLAGRHVGGADLSVGRLRDCRWDHRHLEGVQSLRPRCRPAFVARAERSRRHSRRGWNIRLSGHDGAGAADVIAVWAIIIGALQLYAALQLRKVIDNAWWLILSGLFSIAFGVVLIGWPGTGALATVWTIAWYAVFFGCMLIDLSFEIKKYKRT